MANPVQINDGLFTAGLVLSAQEARTGLSALVAHDGAGARLGVFYEGTQTLVTGTATTSPSMQVSVAPLAFCGQKASSEGVYVGRSPGQVFVDIAAAPASNSRIDVVYAMQRDANSTTSPDGITQGEVGVITGTAAVSPTKPAIPAGAVEVGTVQVPAGATSTTDATHPPTITTTCQWTTGSGAPIPVRNATEQTALTAYDQLAVSRLDLHSRQVYNGADSAWYPRTGTNIAGAGWADNTGTPFNGTSYRRTADGLCQLSGLLYRTDPTFGTTSGVFYVIGFVPSWMAPTDCAKQFDVWSSLGPGAVVRVTTAGQVSFASIGSSFNVVSGTFSVSVEGSWWR
jgi:hypothetical protein